MSRIVWDQVSEREFETGTDRGVLYPATNSGTYPAGVAWNGLTGVDENPTGGEADKIYADNMQYLSLYSVEEFEATITAYTYPEEFEACDGSAEVAPGVLIGQQERKAFGFSYRTIVGNDTEGNDHGYKIHLIYGCKASPSSRSYATVNDSPEAIEFSWDLTTVPVPVAGYKPTATIVIDSTKSNVTPGNLAVLEAILYGVDATAFSTTATYKVGDAVTNEEKTYVCTTAVTTAGAWNAANWTEIETTGPRLPLPAEVISLMTPAD